MLPQEQSAAMGPVKVVRSQSSREMPSIPTLNLTPRLGIQLQEYANCTASLPRSYRNQSGTLNRKLATMMATVAFWKTSRFSLGTKSRPNPPSRGRKVAKSINWAVPLMKNSKRISLKIQARYFQKAKARKPSIITKA